MHRRQHNCLELNRRLHNKTVRNWHHRLHNKTVRNWHHTLHNKTVRNWHHRLHNKTVKNSHHRLHKKTVWNLHHRLLNKTVRNLSHYFWLHSKLASFWLSKNLPFLESDSIYSSVFQFWSQAVGDDSYFTSCASCSWYAVSYTHLTLPTMAVV